MEIQREIAPSDTLDARFIHSQDTTPAQSIRSPKFEPREKDQISIQISVPSTANSLDPESQSKPQPPPYHVFTRARKKQMVYLVSIAALFSPLSSNIYFPALGEVAKELNVSLSLATLTITIYMIVQGIAPSFWGSYSDVIGRRPIFMGTFVIYLIANIALAVSQNYGELMAFRALQAAGSAATISIGAGVIGDITTSAERGGLIGAFGGVRMLGQAVGPVLGGIITQFLGFRAIFWFLTIVGGLSLTTIVFFLPETLRSIAGNGTVPLTGIHKPVIYMIIGQRDAKDPEPDDVQPKRKVTFTTIFAPLRFLGEKDVFITLFFGSIVYTVWSMITSTTTALFEEIYHLNSLMVGVTFLANGAGCMTGSFTTGYLMDFNHRKTEAEYRNSHGYPADTPVNSKTHADFPIEYARMRNTWWITAIFIIATVGYGFSLETHMAVPIILQFLTAYSATAVFSINSALVIDLYPGASASATAVNNLMRCLIGAGGVAIAQPMIDALTPRYTFLLLAGITAVLSPLLWVEQKWGAGWRAARAQRLNAKAQGK
ncbi:hypothetical protein DTO271D3_841 [Paecilomyces variotii]|nr:hypothetical protein DTO032I3_6920 [Paecilomyces variotii]KAJ9274758.1 hypothetical protein DTO021D3_8342 [Paecilomyces variotii]KAJ9287066.1 hypothetical protein DTO021C3_5398 [Paecilomyces variotii]KAJ9318711.1 hypothetical protein DTO271D3_841 [Paecilomyces variotii]KAJ9325533.1 hypothetical protein DTO027B3_3469 [Paecilomyces variotii]